MSNPTELPDLDRLEALARAATPGPWAYQEDSDAYTHIVRPVASPGWIIASGTQTSKPEGEANGRWIAAANPAAVLALIALARRPPVPAQRPTDDELWDSTIRDRDTYHEWADKLADAIAVHFGVDIGEHSNQNCPWHEALEAIESAEPDRRAQPEGEAPQAEPLSDAQLDRIARSYFSEQWAVQHAKDAIHDAFLEASKSKPAAQQAAAPEDVDLRKDEATRLRRVVRAMGIDHQVPGNDARLRDCLFSVLGIIAGKLESAPGTPEAPADQDATDAARYRVLRNNATPLAVALSMRIEFVELGLDEPIESRIDSLCDQFIAAQLDGGQEGSGK